MSYFADIHADLTGVDITEKSVNKQQIKRSEKTDVRAFHHACVLYFVCAILTEFADMLILW